MYQVGFDLQAVPSAFWLNRSAAGERVEAVLGSDHLVPFRLKRGGHLAEGRAIGPDPVSEHDALF
jgi:hypothetical protein